MSKVNSLKLKWDLLHWSLLLWKTQRFFLQHLNNFFHKNIFIQFYFREKHIKNSLMFKHQHLRLGMQGYTRGLLGHPRNSIKKYYKWKNLKRDFVTTFYPSRISRTALISNNFWLHPCMQMYSNFIFLHIYLNIDSEFITNLNKKIHYISNNNRIAISLRYL